MNNLENECCLRIARSLDAEAARTRGDSYLRKLVEEQAAKYRAHAANNSGPVREQPNRDELIWRCPIPGGLGGGSVASFTALTIQLPFGFSASGT
jgi:hypothetical protein